MLGMEPRESFMYVIRFSTEYAHITLESSICFKCMCVHVYMCVHLHECALVYVHTCPCTHVCTHVCDEVHVCTSVYRNQRST